MMGERILQGQTENEHPVEWDPFLSPLAGS